MSLNIYKQGYSFPIFSVPVIQPANQIKLETGTIKINLKHSLTLTLCLLKLFSKLF